MAYLDKDAYMARAGYAARRAADNRAVGTAAGLTEAQADALIEICSLRHAIHCNATAYYWAETAAHEQTRANVRALQELCAGLDGLAETAGRVAYYDLDEVATSVDAEFYDAEADGDYDDFVADLMSQSAAAMDDFNRLVESFLRDVDSRFGTCFCPSGATRIF